MGNEQKVNGNVILTGGSKGIGKAIAEKFAAARYPVLMCSRTESSLLQAAADITNKYPDAIVKTFTADLSDVQQVTAFADWCLQHGAPAILVNNAGSYLPGNASDEGEGNLQAMMETNFYSAYHLTCQLLPAMKTARNGHIFNMCSIASLHAYEGGGSYSISKFALNGFSQNLRHELKKSGIRVTAVFPGAVMTDSWAGFDNSERRIMEAEDIATMVFAAAQLSPQAVVEEIVLRPQLGDM